MRSISFEQAKSMYVHRYTVEHIPDWARHQNTSNGKYYAPQYASDKEWYDNTLFYGESELTTKSHCFSSSPSWPLGVWLDKPLV